MLKKKNDRNDQDRIIENSGRHYQKNPNEKIPKTKIYHPSRSFQGGLPLGQGIEDIALDYLIRLG